MFGQLRATGGQPGLALAPLIAQALTGRGALVTLCPQLGQLTTGRGDGLFGGAQLARQAVALHGIALHLLPHLLDLRSDGL